jgi:hypothetical protein
MHSLLSCRVLLNLRGASIDSSGSLDTRPRDRMGRPVQESMPLAFARPLGDTTTDLPEGEAAMQLSVVQTHGRTDVEDNLQG